MVSLLVKTVNFLEAFNLSQDRIYGCWQFHKHLFLELMLLTVISASIDEPNTKMASKFRFPKTKEHINHSCIFKTSNHLELIQRNLEATGYEIKAS